MRIGLVALLFLPAVALAQRGGGFDLSHNAIAGGGATFSSGGDYRLGGTIGQAAAGPLNGGPFAVHAGFWSAPPSVAPPTATATLTAALSTPTRTSPPSPSATTTHSLTPTQIASTPLATSSPTRSSTLTATTGTPTDGPTALASPSSTPTPSPTPTPTPDAETCSGDCNRDGAVTVDELVRGVNVALGAAAVDTCAAMDGNADGTVAVNELIAGVNRALSGCPTAATGAAAVPPPAGPADVRAVAVIVEDVRMVGNGAPAVHVVDAAVAVVVDSIAGDLAGGDPNVGEVWMVDVDADGSTCRT
jgi:hypothetical protein